MEKNNKKRNSAWEMLMCFLLKKIQENDISYMSRDLKKKCCLNENLKMTKNIYFGFDHILGQVCFVLNFILYFIFLFNGMVFMPYFGFFF